MTLSVESVLLSSQDYSQRLIDVMDLRIMELIRCKVSIIKKCALDQSYIL